MSPELAFWLPLRTHSGNHGHGREHWAARARRVKKEREAVALLWPRRSPVPPFPVEVLLVRRSPGELDDDNLRPALKAVRDEVARLLGVDDRDPRVAWKYAQARGPYAVGVYISEAT